MAGSAVNLTGMLNQLSGSFQNVGRGDAVGGLLTNLIAQTATNKVDMQDPEAIKAEIARLYDRGRLAEAEQLASMAKNLYGSPGNAVQKPSEQQVFEYLTHIVDNPDKFSTDVVEAAKVKLKLVKGAGNEVSQQISMIGGVPYRFNPNTGVMEPVRVKGQEVTPEQVGANAGTVKAGEEAGAAAIRRAEEAYTMLGNVEQSILSIDKAISALDKGAKSGAIQQYFPSIRSASIELDNAQKELGLDVIAMGKFGPLSEGEMRLALTTAIPPLPEPELRVYLLEKKAAQEKFAKELRKTAKYLSTPGNTLNSYLEMLEEEEKANKAGGPSVGRFKVTKVSD